MSRKRTVLSLSLFPFLAVLICTMGVLVAMLLLVVKQAENTQIADQVQQLSEVESQIEQIQWRLGELQIRNTLWKEHRTQYQEKLTSQRGMLGHLENEMARVQAEANSLAEQLLRLETVDSFQLDQQTLVQTLDRKSAEIEKLQQAIEQAKIEFAQAAAKPRPAATPVYSIVPIAAQSGTNRRPIYIECRSDTMTLYPGGITLSINDFIFPMAPGNPLDAALLAYREYWRRQNPQDANTSSAYPLMVVRPSGAKWYSIARRAMSGWDQEFGYELVPEDWEVQYGPEDPKLSAEVRQAIQRAKARQNVLVEMGHAVPAQQALAASRENSPSQSNLGLVPQSNGGFSPAPLSGSDSLTRGGRNSGRGPASGESTDRLAEGGRSPSRHAPDPVAAFSQQFHHTSPSSRTSELETSGSGEEAKQAAWFSSSRSTPATPNLLDGDRQGNDSGKVKRGGQSRSEANASPSPTGQGSSSAFASSMPQTDVAPTRTSDVQQASTTSTPSSNWNSQSLAHQRGEDWGLASRRQNVSAYHRPIKVRLTEKSVILKAGEGSPSDQEIPFEKSVDETVDLMAHAIWKRVEKWGFLGFGGYWKPVLVLEHDPDLTPLRRDLENLLEGSGWDIVTEDRS